MRDNHRRTPQIRSKMPAISATADAASEIDPSKVKIVTVTAPDAHAELHRAWPLTPTKRRRRIVKRSQAEAEESPRTFPAGVSMRCQSILAY